MGPSCTGATARKQKSVEEDEGGFDLKMMRSTSVAGRVCTHRRNNLAIWRSHSESFAWQFESSLLAIRNRLEDAIEGNGRR